MINYHRMNNTNIFDVVNEYVNYYNNYENGCWTKEKAYKRIHQIMNMDDSLCYLQYDDDKLVGFVMSYYKEFDDFIVCLILHYQYNNLTISIVAITMELFFPFVINYSSTYL